MFRKLATRAAIVMLIMAGMGAGTLTSLGTPNNTASAGRGAPKPNVILLLSDDQRWDTLLAMPVVRERLAAMGLRFQHGYVTNALCCPSRATILTGQYSHTNGVYTNVPDAMWRGEHIGADEAFDPSSTIATWLDGAGYETGLFGKYLNGWDAAEDSVPPGWDRWFATWGNAGYFDFTGAHGLVEEHYGKQASDYGTHVVTDEAIRFLRQADPSDPVFLYYAPHSPHKPAIPGPKDLTRYSNLPDWRPRSYDERDVSDKPRYMRETSRISDKKRREWDELRLDQLRSIRTMDREIGRLLKTLADAGRLHNSIIVFTSDNGYLWGEHRRHGKDVPYEEAVRVPMIVRWDGHVNHSSDSSNLVLNLDLAPTLAAAAGVDAPGVEGRSVLPLLTSGTATWRQRFLIEHVSVGKDNGVPTYCAVHTERWVMIGYATGEKELYDLDHDPGQLKNLAGVPIFKQQRIALMHQLRQMCVPLEPGMAKL